MRDPLEQLFIEYKDTVYRFFLRSTNNSHKAEELTQETFLKAFKGIRKFRGESSLKTWLFRIARNTYLNELKKKSNRMEQQVGDNTSEWPDKRNEYRAVDEQLYIQQVLNSLQEEQRIFIILRDFQDFSYTEIAEILSLTEGQVKIGIYRARKQFKKVYQIQEEGINREINL